MINIEIVHFPFLDGDILGRSPSYGVYISPRVNSNVFDFNNRNQFLTAKLLNGDYILI